METNDIAKQIEDSVNNFDLRYAKLWKRIAAFIIDCLIIFLGMILIGMAINFSKLNSFLPPNSDLVSFLPLLAIFAFYFKDGIHKGQSVGKKIFGITVIRKSNNHYCTLFQSFIRNILYSLTIIDWIFLYFNGKQRLGDKAANTIVVNTNSIINY